MFPPRSFGRILRAVSVTAVLVLGLLVSVSRPGPGEVRDRLTRAAETTTACAAVRLVAVDGSRTGITPVLQPAVRALRAGVEANGRRLAVEHVRGEFPSASTMVPRREWRRPVGTVVTPARVRAWRADVSRTITATMSRLQAAAQRCPEQHLVLAGFGQGASVVHRLLLRLREDQTVRPRIVGALLLSDPDRAARTTAALTGAPAAFRSGQGLVSWRLSSVGDTTLGGQPVLVHQVCTRTDVSCDPRAGSRFSAALGTYRSYGSKGAAAVAAAGTRLATRTVVWPVAPADQIVTVDPGMPFQVQLAANVPAGRTGTLSWSDAAAVPPGVTLSASGLLSGSISKPGASRITYRVRNTAPATSATSGAVTLVVRQPSRGESAAGRTSCETRGDGSAWCWGDNAYGQLGDGTTTRRTAPAPVSGGQTWRQVSTGGSATCGVTEGRALFCWGLNNRGQLGLGGGPQRTTPQRVGSATDWAAVSVGWMHTCATRVDGALYCWGGNDEGQLGLGVTGDRSSPVRVAGDRSWKSVTVGGWHSCAIQQGGVPWCWGRNDLAQLGSGDTARRLSPTKVAGSPGVVTEMDASWSGTCALSADASVRCWGMNDQGQIGDGTKVQRSYPTLVGGGHQWATVAVGDSHSCGVDLAGVAWCWGSNRYGQVGDATTVNRSTPVRVAGTDRWSGIDAGWMHTCALALGGRSVCWGNNEVGQLGTGDTRDRVAVPGVAPRPVTQRAAFKKQVVVTSFNILGSEHTEPGADAREFAPGRVRSEWAVNLLQSYGTGLVGFQELNLDQRWVIQRSMRSSWSFYPPTSVGQRGVWQTVGWDRSQWTMVNARMVDIPFRGKTRPNPLVELENVFTGKHVFLFNIHNSAKNTAEREAERDKATQIEINEVNKERARPIEGLLFGDFNEHDEAFCKVVGKTDLEAVNGGSVVGTTCTPPKYPRIDWMFHSPGFGLIDYAFEKSGRVKRVTDHWVLTSRLTVPGA